MLAELTQTLKALHLYGMATALSELQAERPRHAPSPEIWLKRLIEAEQVDRQTRSLKYQLRVAKFPLHRDFTGFDWRETALQEAQVQQLATGAFMDSAHNLILVGGTGTGKTHCAIALGWLPSTRASGCALQRGGSGQSTGAGEGPRPFRPPGTAPDPDGCGHPR